MADSSIRKRINQLIREAQSAGDVEQARALVRQALDMDPSSEKANLWMATLSGDRDQREYYIQRVLEINPRNRIAPYLRRVRTPEERAENEQSESQPQTMKQGNPLRFLFIVAGFSILVIGIMIHGLVTEYQADTYLANNGNQAMATITDKTERHDEDASYYRLWYTFDTVYNNEVITVEDVNSEVLEAVYDVVQIGDQYEITYLPEDPTVAQLSKIANTPALEEQFTRDLILFIFIATIPIDIAVVSLVIKRTMNKKKTEGQYNQDIHTDF